MRHLALEHSASLAICPVPPRRGGGVFGVVTACWAHQSPGLLCKLAWTGLGLMFQIQVPLRANPYGHLLAHHPKVFNLFCHLSRYSWTVLCWQCDVSAHARFLRAWQEPAACFFASLFSRTERGQSFNIYAWKL